MKILKSLTDFHIVVTESTVIQKSPHCHIVHTLIHNRCTSAEFSAN